MGLAAAFCLIFGSCLSASIQEKKSGLSISVTSDWRKVEVAGLIENRLSQLKKIGLKRKKWQTFFSVYVGDEGSFESNPAMLGTYKVEDGKISFIPRFYFEPEIAYTIVVKPALLGKLLDIEFPDSIRMIHSFSFASDKAISKPVVSRVYPTGDKLPANLLRFYIYFSESMNEKNTFDFIKILDSKNQEVTDAFVDIKNGLWDSESRRLTVILHPGRIKRGVGLNLTMGETFTESKKYKLLIKKELHSSFGHSLPDDFVKEFEILEHDRVSPNYKNWQLITPGADTTEPLQLTLDKPLDHALLMRFIEVRDSADVRIIGTISLSNNEMAWVFTPEKTWNHGSYKLVVNPALEDLAGNRMDHPFDVNTTKYSVDESGTQITIKFKIAKSVPTQLN